MIQKQPRRTEDHQRAVLDRRQSSAAGPHKQKKNSRLADKQQEIEASEEAFDFEDDNGYWTD